MLGPAGGFILPEDSSKVVFLGGGIGIIPFKSMIKCATDRRLSHRIALLYSNRTPEDIVYKHEWATLEQQSSNKGGPHHNEPLFDF